MAMFGSSAPERCAAGREVKSDVAAKIPGYIKKNSERDRHSNLAPLGINRTLRLGLQFV
jgi:hypothetical protein